MPVQFDNTIVYDRGTAQTVEESFRIYSSWSQIHDFNFDSIVDEASLSPSLGASWDSKSIISGDLPFDLVIEYDVDGPGHGVVLKYDSVAGTYMIFGVTSDGYMVIYEFNGVINSLVHKMPVDTALYGHIRVSTRQQRFSDDETDIWHTVSMWVDDSLVGTHTMLLGEADENEYEIGVIVESTSRTFTNIRVPQLTEFTEWSSVDPGESPQGGLERSIEGRYVKYFIRFDGSMRAWTSRLASNVRTFTKAELYVLNWAYDKRSLYNHVRMTGGYAQAEFVRADLISQFGHRFIEINNPYLLTEIACRREAERQIRRMEERYSTGVVASVYTPIIEIEDRIAGPAGDHIVTSRKYEFTPTTVTQELELRKYTGDYGA